MNFTPRFLVSLRPCWRRSSPWLKNGPLKTKHAAFVQPTGTLQRTPDLSWWIWNIPASSATHTHQPGSKAWADGSIIPLLLCLLAIPLWHCLEIPSLSWTSFAFTKFPTPKHNLGKYKLLSPHRDLTGIFPQEAASTNFQLGFLPELLFLLPCFPLPIPFV